MGGQRGHARGRRFLEFILFPFFWSRGVILSLYFTFSSSSTISLDDKSDESLIIELKNVKLPHDINSYASFVLRHGSIVAMNSLLLAMNNSNRNISNKVP